MKRNHVLWTIQGLLAALFLFAGVMKLVLPIETMTGPGALPGPFLRFIGMAETLGAIGLILPGLTRIHQELTPAAAAGLAIIMIGATTLTAATGSAAGALFPLIVGVLAASVAVGRSRQPVLS
jgi:DoxX-like family